MKFDKKTIPVIRRMATTIFWTSTLIVLIYILSAIPDYYMDCKFLNKSITATLGLCGAISFLSVINSFLEPNGEIETYHAGLFLLSAIEIILVIYFIKARVFGIDGFYVFHDLLSTAIILLGLWLLTWQLVISDRARRTILFSNRFCEKQIQKNDDGYKLMLGTGIFISAFSILTTVSVELVDRFILGV